MSATVLRYRVTNTLYDPELPAGFAYLVDSQGNQILDSNGNPIIVASAD